MRRVLFAAVIAAAAALPSFAASPAADALSTALTFGPDGVTAHVTPSADTTLFARVTYKRQTSVEMALRSDTDNDGAVPWPIRTGPEVSGVVTVVDMTARAVHAARMDGNHVPVAPLNVNIMQDTAGNQVWLHFPFGGAWELVWVRPGAGAWATVAIDEAAFDMDGAANGRMLLKLQGAYGIDGSGQAPSQFENGDILVGVAKDGGKVFGGTVDQFLAAAASTPSVIYPQVDPCSEACGRVNVKLWRLGSTAGVAKLQYHTTNGTATAGSEYLAAAGSITFPPGEVMRSIDVSVFDDFVYSGTTAFTLSLTGVTGADLDGPAELSCTIEDDDPRPVLELAGNSVDEGGDGAHTVPVEMTLVGSTRRITVVNWTWTLTGAGNPAPSGGGEIVFNPGETTKTILVPYTGNTTADADRMITVRATSEHATLRSPTIVMILDDDSLGVTSDDLFVDESEGTVQLRLALNRAHSEPVSVGTRILHGNTEEEDVVYPAQRIVFMPGETTLYVPVTIVRDTALEPVEQAIVELFDPSPGLVIRRTQVVITIRDDESVFPPITAGDPVVSAEAAGAAAAVTFHIDPQQMQRSVELVATTLGGSAQQDRDFIWSSGTFRIGGDVHSHTIVVRLLQDLRVEPSETFSVQVTSPGDPGVVLATAHVTIADMDPSLPSVLPVLTIDPVMTPEISGGTARFTVSLSAAPSSDVTFHVETAAGTATPGVDFTPVSRTITIAAGVTAASIDVPILDEHEEEPSEWFTLGVSGAVNAHVATPAAIGRIVDQGELGGNSWVSIEDVSVDEAAGIAHFVVRLSFVQPASLAVAFATVDGSAISGEDYAAQTGTVVFAPGEVAKQIAVAIVDDGRREEDDDFTVQLQPGPGYFVVDGEATCTIVNDDTGAARRSRSVRH